MAIQDVNATVPVGIPAAGTCVAGSGQPPDLTSETYGSATACWLGSESRPNSNWANIDLIGAFQDSWFNSLQFVATKRYSRGLEFSSAYTWERLIDQVPALATGDKGGSVTTATAVIPRQYDQGPADWEVHQAWHLSTIYRFPRMSGLHGFTGAVLNGWWVSGILTAQTGLPFTAYLSTPRSHDGEPSGTDRPNLVPGRTPYSVTHGVSTSNGIDPCPTAGEPLGTPNLWFDPCAFAIQPSGFLGNEARNLFTAPGVFNLDFSAVKDTKLAFLGEAGNLEFRAEFFNILNHANFSRPNQRVYAGKASVETPLGNAGQITSTDTTSRQIQFALKIIF